MAERTKRNWIYAAKGYGMILVILAHISEYSPVGMIIYSFHMPLFFFISGYLFSAKGSFAEFAERKTKRLIVPYFIYAIPLILWDAFITRGKDYWQYAPVFEGFKLLSIDSYHGTYDWSTVPEPSIISVLFRDVLGLIIQKRMWTMWFLACLILLSFLFYFIVKVIKREWIRAVIVMLLTAGGFVFYFCGGKPLVWNIDVCLTAGLFYYVGYLIRKKNLMEELIRWEKRIYVLIGTVVVNLLFCWLNIRISGYGLDMYNSDYGVLPVMYIAAFAGTGSVIIFGSLFSTRYIRWIGRHSMVFFIFHQQICIPLYESLLSKLKILQGEGIIEPIRVMVILILTCATLTGTIYAVERLQRKYILELGA
jgi:fucose 4-O-acetylase-like acetyltransferase